MVARSKAVLCLLWPIANSAGLDEQAGHGNGCEIHGTECCRRPHADDVEGYNYDELPGDLWPKQTLKVTCKKNYYSKNGSDPKATCAGGSGEDGEEFDFNDDLPRWQFSGCERKLTKADKAGIVYYTAPADTGVVKPLPENNTLAELWEELRSDKAIYKQDGLRALCVVNTEHVTLLFKAPHASDMHRRRLHGHDELHSEALRTERTPSMERTRQETLLKTACREFFDNDLPVSTTTATTTSSVLVSAAAATTTSANIIDETFPTPTTTISANMTDESFPVRNDTDVISANMTTTPAPNTTATEIMAPR
jgi:hypothetical protein